MINQMGGVDANLFVLELVMQITDWMEIKVKLKIYFRQTYKNVRIQMHLL